MPDLKIVYRSGHALQETKQYISNAHKYMSHESYESYAHMAYELPILFQAASQSDHEGCHHVGSELRWADANGGANGRLQKEPSP